MHKKRQYLKFLSDVTLWKTVEKIFQLPRTLQIEISQCSTLKKKSLTSLWCHLPQRTWRKKKKKKLNLKLLAGHGPSEQMGNSKGHGSRSSFIEFRFSRDGDHEGLTKRKREHNRESEWEVSITRSRRAEEARKDQQKKKRDWRVGERKSKRKRRALNSRTYAETHEINILKTPSAPFKRKQWLDQVAGPPRCESQVTHGGRQPRERLLPYCPCRIHSCRVWAWARP